MIKEKTIWSAQFTGFEILDGENNYRRLNFREVRNPKGVLTRMDFSIEENEQLQIGNVNKHEIICFATADETLDRVIKFYPTQNELDIRREKWLSENLTKGGQNERSE